MNTSKLLGVSGTLLCGLLLGASAFAVPTYTVTDLGDLPMGSDRSYAYGVNNNGQVVGRGSSPGGTYEPFLWEKDAGMQGLGVLGDGSSISTAVSINDNGQVVGRSDGRGFLWQEDTGLVDLNDRYDIADIRSATDINNNGQIAANAGGYGALLEPGGQATSVGALPGLESRSFVYGINDNAEIAGYSGNTQSGRAFVWSSGTGMTNLGVLPGMEASIAEGINNNTDVVGYMRGSDSALQAFFWNEATGLTGLDNSAGQNSVAFSINDAGYIVGRAGSAMLWDEQLNPYRLDELVNPDDPLFGEVSLSSAWDINDAGQIVGWGLIDNAYHAFLLDPVDVSEPASLSLLALFLVPLLVKRRSRFCKS